jgi:phage baseplate assembly protein gpV
LIKILQLIEIKKHRIRVKRLWQQAKNLRSPWLRVMTPDAGTSGEVPKNRGMVFIPEIGDQVMLGFRYNDPNRPFVLGSMYNGTTGAGGQEKNHLKSIFTRGGSTITFNELDNSILIKDPSGNTWFMDWKGNISVKAPKTFSVEATDIILTALKNSTSSAGVNIAESAGVNHSISAGAMMNQMAGADYSLMAANIMEVAQGERKSKAKDVKELSKNNQMPPKVETQYFYKETLFGACGDELIDLDSDFYEEGLQDCMDQRVALIWLLSQDDKKNDSIFNRVIRLWSDHFIKDSTHPRGKRRTLIKRRDSILIKGKTWKILKKGKIERN